MGHVTKLGANRCEFSCRIPLCANLFQFGAGLAEDAARDDELLNLLGAFEDVENLSAGSG
ncbi:hypothetical protein [Nocardia sp. CNY236]|uniref:hypothetical protein n=1 Tax=Nocardia sp. CNY236 TaxID=1169152 RepID=UPI0018CA244A|nr:hypothetical protein [Nocardia sp. CNY236]